MEIKLRKIALNVCINDEEQYATSIREPKFLARLENANLIRYYATYEYPSVENAKTTLLILMELCSGGSLEDAIKRGDFKFKVSNVLSVINNCLQGLLHLHSKSLIHRDIKPANILLTANNVAKIADFGLVQEAKMTRLTYGPGTFAYRAPETIHGRYTTKVDVFSLGVVLEEIVLSINFKTSMVYAHIRTSANGPRDLLDGWKEGISEENSQLFASLIRLMTEERPENRPSTNELLMDVVPNNGATVSLRQRLNADFKEAQLQRVLEATGESKFTERLRLWLEIVERGILLDDEEVTDIIISSQTLKKLVTPEHFKGLTDMEKLQHSDVAVKLLDQVFEHVERMNIDDVRNGLIDWANNKFDISQLTQVDRYACEKVRRERALENYQRARRFVEGFPVLFPRRLRLLRKFLHRLRVDRMEEYLKLKREIVEAIEEQGSNPEVDEELRKVQLEIKVEPQREALLNLARECGIRRDFVQQLHCWKSIVDLGVELMQDERDELRDACRPLKAQSTLEELRNFSQAEVIEHSELANAIIEKFIAQTDEYYEVEKQELVDNWWENASELQKFEAGPSDNEKAEKFYALVKGVILPTDGPIAHERLYLLPDAISRLTDRRRQENEFLHLHEELVAYGKRHQRRSNDVLKSAIRIIEEQLNKSAGVRSGTSAETLRALQRPSTKKHRAAPQRVHFSTTRHFPISFS